MLRDHVGSIKLRAVVLPVLMLALGLVGCARTQRVAMSGTPKVPAAQGMVMTKQAKSGNVDFEVKVKHMAQPYQLGNGAKTYVVWVQPEDPSRPPQNMGALTIDPKDLDGRFVGVTPYHNFRVIITAESHPTVQSPSNNVVLSTRIYQPTA